MFSPLHPSCTPAHPRSPSLGTQGLTLHPRTYSLGTQGLTPPRSHLKEPTCGFVELHFLVCVLIFPALGKLSRNGPKAKLKTVLVIIALNIPICVHVFFFLFTTSQNDTGLHLSWLLGILNYIKSNVLYTHTWIQSVSSQSSSLFPAAYFNASLI